MGFIEIVLLRQRLESYKLCGCLGRSWITEAGFSKAHGQGGATQEEMPGKRKVKASRV